jgi:two-component system phosphate regulon sensor histidine kinase PhoR
MNAAKSTRRFLRRLSIAMLLAVLVVGLAGLTAIWLSNSRSARITDTIDPALTANGSVLQVLTAAQSQQRGILLPGASTDGGPTPDSLDAALAEPLQIVTLAHHDDPRFSALVQAEKSAAQTWLAAYGDVRDEVAAGQRDRAISREAEADVDFTQFQQTNSQVSERLTRTRQSLRGQADHLSNAAELVFGALVLAVLAMLACIGAVASRVLVTPMAELTAVVERLRRGERGARAPTNHGSTEVRSVAVQVNALADEVDTWRAAEAETDRLRRIFGEISRTVREELDLEAVLDAPAMVGPALAADRCWLRLVRDGHLEPVTTQWSREGLDSLTDIPLAGEDPFELAQRLWIREEAMVRSDLFARLDQEAENLQLFVATTGVRSVLVVPIGAGDQVLGLLTWAMTDRPRTWTAAEVAAVQRVAADLGRAVVHAQLYHQQLELVGKLRDLDRRKDDFLSTVSHELRTPLTSIVGYLELVRDGAAGAVPEPMGKMLDVIDRNAIRLRALIEDLLVLARIEDGSLGATHTAVEFAEVIDHAAETVRPQAEEGGVLLFVDPGPVGLTVMGDARHLDMVALNILSNAVKFTPSGGRVSVVVRYDDDAHEVLLTCSDSGIGIPEVDQAGMFGRFFRASNATVHAIPGTGLGMSVIKGIVDAHGGAVALTSREGKGTIVTVRLPGATIEPAETGATGPREPSEAAERALP